MRISDWSSDVCSSDLHTLVQQRRTHRHTMATFQTYDSVGAKEDVSDVISMLTPHKVPFSTSIGSETVQQKVYQWQEDELDPAQDRKSVVEGKSGSVQVDCVVRRIIKKKKKKNKNTQKE